ncbi:DNA-directed RNA polymerases i and iii subunit rpc19 [Phtheirospermum japonicum]|uniref:DNA-directed RNA polymerases i and iii subunit rpc19 n=1 Tax=Phtheirospermum japonicum TaxID=374723 RepID=A0A830BR36_9LAMI|nr:DNA-directed RNA polymerases i and iii subunit rpc19 [Phtheirospermum japonicum]
MHVEILVIVIIFLLVIVISIGVVSTEHGEKDDPTQSTFSLTDEDHTLANSLRYILNQDIPHPADAQVNLRVQTTGDTAREVLIDSCQDLMLVCQHVRSTVDQAVMVFKSKQGVESMDIK